MTPTPPSGDFITIDAQTAREIEGASERLIMALAGMGYPVSAAARPELHDNGSIQAVELNEAAIEFTLTLAKLRERL